MDRIALISDLHGNIPALEATLYDIRRRNIQRIFYLARIIHQPEKSTGEGDFVVQMNPKTTVSQAYGAPTTLSSGLPDTINLGRMGATGRTASCQPPGASRSCLARAPLGLSIDLTGPARAGARRPIQSTSAGGPVPPGTMRATLS